VWYCFCFRGTAQSIGQPSSTAYTPPASVSPASAPFTAEEGIMSLENPEDTVMRAATTTSPPIPLPSQRTPSTPTLTFGGMPLGQTSQPPQTPHVSGATLQYPGAPPGGAALAFTQQGGLIHSSSKVGTRQQRTYTAAAHTQQQQQGGQTAAAPQGHSPLPQWTKGPAAPGPCRPDIHTGVHLSTLEASCLALVHHRPLHWHRLPLPSSPSPHNPLLRSRSPCSFPLSNPTPSDPSFSSPLPNSLLSSRFIPSNYLPRNPLLCKPSHTHPPNTTGRDSGAHCAHRSDACICTPWANHTASLHRHEKKKKGQ